MKNVTVVSGHRIFSLLQYYNLKLINVIACALLLRKINTETTTKFIDMDGYVVDYHHYSHLNVNSVFSVLIS